MLSPETIRLYADGELTGPDLAAFESELAADNRLRACVEFERSLRRRVGEMMSSAAAPAELVASVREAIAASAPLESSSTSTSTSQPRSTSPASVSPAPSPSPLRRLFAGPTRVNVFAVAACLALVSVAVLYGIFGRTIDEHGHLVSDDAVQQLVVDSAAESSRLHGSCAASRKNREERLVWKTEAEARDGLTDLLDVQTDQLQFFDLSELGFEFYGCGRCQMPGDRPAAQIAYVRSPTESTSGVMVSFFIVPNDGQYDAAMNAAMRRGQWYRCDDVARNRRCHHKVLRTIDDRFVYFLVCCDDDMLNELSAVVTQQMEGE